MVTGVQAGSDPSTGQMTFQTTHWSVVLAAREQAGGAAQDALARLCRSYWYPLYAFVRRQGASPHDAEDLTQEFFRLFLEKNSLLKVSPAAGKFRSFLLACLKHFLAHEREKANAQRRGGGQVPIRLEAAAAETRYLMEPADPLPPDLLFERRWAWAVLDQTMEELRREYAARQKADLFDELRGFLPGGPSGASRGELAARRGVSPGAIDVAVHRLRQRFGALLREQVAQTVSSEAEVNEEIRYLMSVVGC